MNDKRANWVALVKECEKCGLPAPQLFPAKLGDKWECEIPGLFRMFDEDANRSIGSCLDFVGGYRIRMERETEAKETDERPVPMNREEALAYSSVIAKEVLESSGLGGPAEHKLLAQAILGLSVAIVMEPK